MSVAVTLYRTVRAAKATDQDRERLAALKQARDAKRAEVSVATRAVREFEQELTGRAVHFERRAIVTVEADGLSDPAVLYLRDGNRLRLCEAPAWVQNAARREIPKRALAG